MTRETGGSTDWTAGHPLLLILVSFPIAYFSGALLTDLAYVCTADIVWADFSAWLLAAGLLMAVLAVVDGLVVLIRNRRSRRTRPIWTLAIGSVIVLCLAFLDNLVHSRDAWTSVMPAGLALSAATVVVLFVTVWLGARSAERRAVEPATLGARP